MTRHMFRKKNDWQRPLSYTGAVLAVLYAAQPAQTFALDWEQTFSRYIAVDGGWVEGSKIPTTPSAQVSYDDVSSKSDDFKVAESQIETRKLRGLEWIGKGRLQWGVEGYTDQLKHQLDLNIVASGILGNSTGVFYAPPGSSIFPHDGLGARNTGWTLGGGGTFHWIPFSSFSAHISSRYMFGSNALKNNFAALDTNAMLAIKAARFALRPSASFIRLLAPDTRPAADILSWSFDLEWLGNDSLKFRNPMGFPLIKKSNIVALGSELLVNALENEGSYLELNLTPRLQITRGLFISSHFRTLFGSNRSYVAPSLAKAIADRALQTDDWSPPESSAEYTSETVEWKNTLTKRIDRGFDISFSVLYTNRSSTYVPSAGSKLQYSALLDKAYESSVRYFLGCEFLL